LAFPAGSFAIFFPEDVHAPLGTDGFIHKVVIKVAVEWDRCHAGNTSWFSKDLDLKFLELENILNQTLESVQAPGISAEEKSANHQIDKSFSLF